MINTPEITKNTSENEINKDSASKDRAEINLYHGDCMKAMAKMEDNQYDLAIVDPPYFSGPEKEKYYHGKNHLADYKKYKKIKHWKVPDKKYIKQLKRVSRNQIIWGVNYYSFALPGGRVIWTKAKIPAAFSQCEIAYHSFYSRIDLFEYLWNGFWQQDMKNKEKRIHQTQKPTALYRWLLEKYAVPGNKILETHGGSMSIAVACWDLKFDLDLWELDPEVFKDGKERFENHIKQGQFDY